MRDLRIATQFRRTDRVDSAKRAAMKPPKSVECGKTAEQMRADTEAYLTRLFKREVRIHAGS